jgi:hypothetical protein
VSDLHGLIADPVMTVTDASARALTGAGTVGLFSWQSGGPTFQHFEATQP